MDPTLYAWRGTDNNVYARSSNFDGVRVLGTAGATNNAGGTAVLHPNGTTTYLQLQADPHPGPAAGAGTTAPTAPSAATPGPAPKVFNQAGATNTQRTIDQIGPILQAALAAEAQRYGNTVNDFNAQEGTQRKTYDASTTTNQQNYDSNFMDSIRSGIHGLSGLVALLRGTGAAGGTAEQEARDTVGGVTSNDIRTGADTQKENQTSLDTSLSTFLTDLQRKRQTAEDTRINNERSYRRDSNTQLQDLYGKMAGFYGDVGNTGAANDWMNRAGALTPEIAANNMAQVSAYDTTPVAVQAPQITAFAAPTQPSVVAPPQDNGQVGAGLFTMTDTRRRKDALPTPAPVGV